MQSRKHKSAFTLIELVTVLVVIAIALAIAAPSLRTWSENSKLRNCSEQFLSATRWARRQAISTAVDQVLAFKLDGSGFVINSDNTVTLNSAEGEYGQQMTLPVGYTITLVTGGEQPSSIRFSMNGRVTPATVEIRTPAGGFVQIACSEIAGNFKVVQTD